MQSPPTHIHRRTHALSLQSAGKQRHFGSSTDTSLGVFSESTILFEPGKKKKKKTEKPRVTGTQKQPHWNPPTDGEQMPQKKCNQGGGIWCLLSAWPTIALEWVKLIHGLSRSAGHTVSLLKWETASSHAPVMFSEQSPLNWLTDAIKNCSEVIFQSLSYGVVTNGEKKLKRNSLLAPL